MKKKGSILAYTLVIMTLMVVIAGMLSVVTVIEKRGASSTDFSVQALQTADSGTQIVKSKISASPTVADLFPTESCDDSGVTAMFENLEVDPGLPEQTFTVSFLAAGGVQMSCSDLSANIKYIKSTGKYKNTVRAIEVAL